MSKFEVAYYTDPLCCWSWAMEPQLRKLRYLLKGDLDLRYVMGGLLKDWEHFNDKMNDIHKPSQMGPLWMEAKH
ncbi:MAG TPA: DsbA family protein, partial [Salinimicrobium sp.]|nr:DsbA family protein [Salinimicrobium sp.]